MKLSVIVPTYNRPHDLERCLNSLFNQILPPQEILVVDNGRKIDAGDLIGSLKSKFLEKGIDLQHLRNPINSLTSARNRGSTASKGEIVLFVDDDVALETNYTAEILSVYERYPGAMGVQGYMGPDNTRGLRDVLNKLFFWFHFEHGRCRVLPSVSATYPQNLDQVMTCEWFSGSNHSYRRKILEEFKCDERLLKYSEGEDLEFSYRVYLRYPGSLYITPKAKIVHSTSLEARTIGKELIYMREIYGLYLYFKLFSPTPKNSFIYLWSRLGRMFFTIGRALMKPSKDIFLELRFLLEAYAICLQRMNLIRYGKLEFFNESLK